VPGGIIISRRTHVTFGDKGTCGKKLEVGVIGGGGQHGLIWRTGNADAGRGAVGQVMGAGSSVGMNGLNGLDGRFLVTQRDTRDYDDDMMQLVRIGREGRRLTPRVESS